MAIVQKTWTRRRKNLTTVLFPTIVTAVTTNTRPQRVFSSVQTCVLVDVNQPLPWFFTGWSREDSFSIVYVTVFRLFIYLIV